MADNVVSSSTTSPPTPILAKILDTTEGSAFHAIGKRLDRLGFGAFIPVVLYLGAIFVTFLPLFIAACFGPSITVRSNTLEMPFLYDASTIFMYLVSLPCLLILTVTDHSLLCRALASVQVDGILTISEANETNLAERWRRLFRNINLSAQALGVATGIITAFFVYKLSSTGSYSSWESGRPLPAAGYVRLYCDFLFTIVAAVYVIRSIAIPVLLREVVASSELHMLPLHPDNAGGLQPIGRLGLRNQYAITVVGLNIGLGWLVSHFLTPNDAFLSFLVMAAIAYSVFGPIAFVGPLLPFRDAMMKNRAQLMSGVALRMRSQLDDLRLRFESGDITADDEQLIERLRKIGQVISDLPVWPFDAITLRKFLTAYIIPVASLIVPLAAKALSLSPK